MNRMWICLFVCCGVLAACPAVQAGNVPIVNPGFEDPVLDEDGYTWLDVPGWT